MTDRRTVTHIIETFVGPSQGWFYDLVSGHRRYRPTVVCASREQSGAYPFPNVRAELPPAGRLTPGWIHGNMARRLGWPRRPLNDWKRALRRLPPADVYHAHFGQSGWRVVNAGLGPTVTSFYGYDAGHERVLRYWGRAYPELFARGAGVVAEGPAMRERLIRLGAPRERAFVVPLVAAVEELRAEPIDLDGPVRVLMAGRFVEKKGFAEGVAAFAAAHGQGLADRLIIIGSGPEERAIRESAQRNGVEGAVELVPLAPRDRYRETMLSCQLFLQPSRVASDGDVEGGAPTTLFDAQALGRVIVATDHADIPFVVDPAAAFLAHEGDVSDLAKVLAAALSAKAEWQDRALAGRRHVERQHSRGAVADALEEVYDGVIGQ